MNPDINYQNQTDAKVDPSEPVKDDKYALSLIQSVNAQYAMEQANAPKRRFISNRKLIYIGLSIVLTVVFFGVSSSLLKTDKIDKINNQTKQLTPPATR